MTLPWARALDTSTWQDNGQTAQRIDWTRPIAAGFRLIVNRATFGALADDDFAYNWSEQRRLGYLRAAYGFFDYRTGSPGATIQAQALVDVLAPDPGEFPVLWIDFERPLATWPALPTRSVCLEMIHDFKTVIEQQLSRRAGLYCNRSMIDHLMSSGGVRVDLPDWLRAMPLWIAAWPAVPAGETLEGYIERVNWRPDLRGQWPAWLMWQAGVLVNGKELGFESAEVDFDFVNMKDAELAAYCGQTEEDPVADWTGNAIGLYTKTAGWTNPAFDFIVGYAGGNWTQQGGQLVLEPNAELKPIEIQAHGEGKPFLALWDFDVDYYRRQQIGANDSTWPPEASDYPLQRLIAALTSREVDGLIIRVMNRKNLDGGNEMMSYVAFAARKFVERANRWLYTNKGLDKWTFVLTSDDFLRTDGAQESFYAWLKNWNLGIEQEAVRPLASGAWPQASDAIKAVPPSLGWKFWYHYNALALDMMIFNGDEAALAAFINFGGGNNPQPDPEPEPEDPPMEMGELLEHIAVMGEQIELIGERLLRVLDILETHFK